MHKIWQQAWLLHYYCGAHNKQIRQKTMMADEKEYGTEKKGFELIFKKRPEGGESMDHTDCLGQVLQQGKQQLPRKLT